MIVPKVEWRIDAGLGDTLNPHQKLAMLVYVQKHGDVYQDKRRAEEVWVSGRPNVTGNRERGRVLTT